MLLVGLWQNRSHPGLTLAFVGILSNATAVLINGDARTIDVESMISLGTLNLRNTRRDGTPPTARSVAGVVVSPLRTIV